MYVVVLYKDRWWIRILRAMGILPEEIQVRLISRKEVKKPMYLRVGHPYHFSTRGIQLADFGDELFINIFITDSLEVVEEYVGITNKKTGTFGKRRKSNKQVSTVTGTRFLPVDPDEECSEGGDKKVMANN